MKKYALIIGLGCCVSCGTNDSKEVPQKDPVALKAKQTATIHKGNARYYEIQEAAEALQKDPVTSKIQQSATTHQGNEVQGDIIKDPQQAVIKLVKEGHVIIHMPGGISKETTNKDDWWFTPQGCGIWDYKTFGEEYKVGDEEITHLWGKQESKTNTGVLPYAIKGLLKKAQGSNIVVIVSIGVRGALGISQEAEDYLKKLRDEDKTIEKYYILNSREVPAIHNECVKNGKQVYTLLHTTC